MKPSRFVVPCALLLSTIGLMGDSCMAPSGELGQPSHRPLPPEQRTREQIRNPERLAWFQLSPDDSTSMATAQLLKMDRSESVFFDAFPLLPHEVVNYYDPPAALRELQDVSRSWLTDEGLRIVVDAERLATAETSGEAEPSEQLDLLIHLYAPQLAEIERRPWNLHLCVDVSGSMAGENLELVRAALQLLIEAMRPGDRLSLTTFSDEGERRFGSIDFDSNRDRIRTEIEALQEQGMTNMLAGLELSYQEAEQAFDPQMINRVLLFSDGMANVGDLDIERYESLTRINNQEGIYLSGIGVGAYYDGRRMNDLTDAGKGAHVFLPQMDEVEIIFGKMVRKLIEVAADEISIEVQLPSAFRLVSFSGEEVSTDPEQRVPNVVLAAGDDMTVLASFASDDSAAFDRDMVLTLRYRPLDTAESLVFEQRLNIGELLKPAGLLMQRTRLVNRYARWACEDDSPIDADSLQADLAGFAPQDAGLNEIAQQLLRLRQ